jgi:hypothetical protein
MYDSTSAPARTIHLAEFSPLRMSCLRNPKWILVVIVRAGRTLTHWSSHLPDSPGTWVNPLNSFDNYTARNQNSPQGRRLQPLPGPWAISLRIGKRSGFQGSKASSSMPPLSSMVPKILPSVLCSLAALIHCWKRGGGGGGGISRSDVLSSFRKC